MVIATYVRERPLTLNSGVYSIMRSLHGSREAFERAKGSIGNGVGSGLRAAFRPHPIYFDSGTGSRLTDIDGNHYIDYVLAWGPMLVGHSHPHVIRNVQQQLERGQLFGSGSLLESRVAERILETVPGMEKVLYSNTGTEAVQIAIRIARATTERRLIVKFTGAYHGWHDSVLINYRGVTDEHVATLNSEGQSPSALQDVIVLPYDDLSAAQAAITERHDEIAAVFVETTLTNSGLIRASDEFLQGLRSLCDDFDIALVFDEVVTGFRLGLGGAVVDRGVEPDLAIYAKAIASGFSLSLIAGKSRFIESVEKGAVHAGTYNASPIALAAADATLDVLSEEGTYDRLQSVTNNLESELRKVIAQHGHCAGVRSMRGIIQILPGTTNSSSATEFEHLDWKLWEDWSSALLLRGIHVLPHGRMFLSTAHSLDDVGDTVAAFDQVLARH